MHQKPRLAVTREVLECVYFLAPEPGFYTGIDVNKAMKITALKDKDALEDAVRQYQRDRNKLNRELRVILGMCSTIGIRRIDTQDMRDALDCCGATGNRFKVGRKFWRLIDDKAMSRGHDCIFTMCAVSEDTIVVADFYWSFCKQAYFVRNEAKGKLTTGFLLHEKTKANYYPINLSVSISDPVYDRAICIAVEPTRR